MFVTPRLGPRLAFCYDGSMSDRPVLPGSAIPETPHANGPVFLTERAHALARRAVARMLEAWPQRAPHHHEPRR